MITPKPSRSASTIRKIMGSAPLGGRTMFASSSSGGSDTRKFIARDRRKHNRRSRPSRGGRNLRHCTRASALPQSPDDRNHDDPRKHEAQPDDDDLQAPQ